MGRVVLLVGCLAIGVRPAAGASFYLACDVPTDLSGSTRLSWEILRHDSGAYGVVWTLPPGTPIAALHRMDGGDWLLAVAVPTDLGGTAFEPRDVIRFDGVNYTPFLAGAAAGVPAGTRVDALFLDGGDDGHLVLSFDTVTTIGDASFASADLVRHASGTWNRYFDSAASGIASSSNVIGADVQAGRTLLTFDVPTTVSGITFLPGEVVSWDGSAFALFHSDASWPLGSRIDALASLAHPGAVPETLEVSRSAADPGGLTLRWSPSCSVGAEEYAIYEGQIGVWYSHARLDCDDDGADLTEDVAPSPGDRYYLVVPTHRNDEGSYGTDSGGNERPRGTELCVATQALAACPREESP